MVAIMSRNTLTLWPPTPYIGYMDGRGKGTPPFNLPSKILRILSDSEGCQTTRPRGYNGVTNLEN